MIIGLFEFVFFCQTFCHPDEQCEEGSRVHKGVAQEKVSHPPCEGGQGDVPRAMRSINETKHPPTPLIKGDYKMIVINKSKNDSFVEETLRKYGEKKFPTKNTSLWGNEGGECGNSGGELTFQHPIFGENPQEFRGYTVHAIVRHAGAEVAVVEPPFGEGAHKGSLGNVAQRLVAEGYAAIRRCNARHPPFEALEVAIGRAQVMVYQDAVHGLPMRCLVEDGAFVAMGIGSGKLHELGNALAYLLVGTEGFAHLRSLVGFRLQRLNLLKRSIYLPAHVQQHRLD